MKISDWICRRCLKKHEKLVKNSIKKSTARSNKTWRDNNKEYVKKKNRKYYLKMKRLRKLDELAR